ncbi:MAG TPA: hypothetical protein DCS43_11115 [Verrucomicrobia bacterium]|nr:hypothetical protein [Verrucomicrobiota bacterium]
MADIEYRCSKCHATRVASEFADVSRLKCNACGETLNKSSHLPPAPTQTTGSNAPAAAPAQMPPAATEASAGTSRLKLAKAQREALDATATPAQAVADKGRPVVESAPKVVKADAPPVPLDLHPKVKRKTKGKNVVLLALLLFVTLGCLTGFLRYGLEFELPGSEYLEPAEKIIDMVLGFAWAGILALNILVVVKAMADNMFQGVLCLIVPGWSVFYLLFISDNFYLRAIVFGCLIGVGQDGSIQIYEQAEKAMVRINDFINTGGGDLKRR